MVKFVLDDANHLDINHIPEHLVLPRQSHGTKDRPTAVFVTQSLTRSYLNLVVVGPAPFVIDFDDSRVVV